MRKIGAATGIDDLPGVAALEHVIVLALENRSFDHVLGYLDHPDGAFDGLRDKHHLGNHLDPRRPTDESWYPVTDTAEYTLPLDPDHEHQGVLGQTEMIRRITNAGFVRSYVDKRLRKARQENLRRFVRVWFRRITLVAALVAGLLALFADLSPAGDAAGAATIALFLWIFTRPQPVTPEQRDAAEAVAPFVMRSFTGDKVPVISKLAKGFTLCQRWHCSVPGETWPNRNFFHSGHSSGSVNIELGFYGDRTIFEVLDDAGHDWRVYFGQLPPQVFFFPYVLERSLTRSSSLRRLFEDLEAGDLPTYSFVEPHHGMIPFGQSGNQHPGKNITGRHDGNDVRRGERLIAEIYQRLAQNPDLFRKTLFVVTYDEHGGLYDHCQTPSAWQAGHRQETLSRRLVRWLRGQRVPLFNFRLLGVRVPCLVISPWAHAARLDSKVRDHSCVPKTLRMRFAPGARPFSIREARAARIDELLSLTEPRASTGDSLPDLTEELAALADVPLFEEEPSDGLQPVEHREPARVEPATRFDWELLALTDAIRHGTVREPSGVPVTATAPTRRRVGLFRPRRLQTRTPEDLGSMFADMHFTLSVLAAEQQEGKA